MTKQEMFDTVARHLLTQRKKSTSDGTCRYRGQGGTRCAIGALIPDEKYNKAFESKNYWNATIAYAAGIGYTTSLLAHDLQQVHDACEVEEWKGMLHYAAIRHDLSPAVLEEFA